MAKLIGLGLENFRVFKEYTEFDFAPLTLLTGANNSGKSSLIKALLLLAVNAEKNLEKFKLNFEEESDTTKLGAFAYLVNDSTKSTISCQLIFDNLYEEQERPVHHQKGTEQIFEKIANLPFQIKLVFNESTNENMINFVLSTMVQGQKIEILSFEFLENAKILQNKYVNYTWLEQLIFQLKGKKLDEKILEELLKKLSEKKDISRFKDLLGVIDFVFETNGISGLRENYHFNILDDILKKVVEIALESIQFGDRIEYLPAFRGSQERFYYSNVNLPLNKLLKQFTDKKFTENSKEKEYINFWINKLGIAKGIEFKPEDGGTRVNIINGSERPMADYGYGITQYLPLLLKIVLNPNKILIIEEGENSLHPNFQSVLADLLIDASKPVNKGGFGIRFIVETHSEYLILKLQYLTAKKEIKPIDTAIYYFYEPNNVPENKKQVERIWIQDDGELEQEFGKGFFDESARLIGNIWKASNL